MCGICGIAHSYNSNAVDEQVLQAMNHSIFHRGPDEDGFYVDALAGIAMRRLSIIDLSTGQQPVTNEDETIFLVFNGEIYNYRELRARLISKGHHFKTQSDTEVIVHAYEEYGVSCAKEFNGMFAFALWDKPRQRMFIARDHVGIKPLFYWTDGKTLVFGSELKALMAHPDVPRQLDPLALDQFLTLEYIPSPRTIFKGVHKLPAGHFMLFQNGNLRVSSYWDIPCIETPDDIDACREILQGLLNDSVKRQLMSDVPLGAFLSGGLDSSTVVALMSKFMSEPVKTFSIGFQDVTYNELPYARLVSRHFLTDHQEEIQKPNIADLAEELIGHLDEPFGDFSIMPTYLVSKMARQKVKVVLSGDGGDELFGGYDSYVAQELHRYYALIPSPVRSGFLPAILEKVKPRPAKKGIINIAKRFVDGASLSPTLQHARWMMFLKDADRAALYSAGLREEMQGQTPAEVLEEHFLRYSTKDSLAQQQYVDIKTYMAEDILTKVDRMSMAVSLEARVPLLDYRIVEFAVNLPPHMKLHNGRTKRILRKAMAGTLPEAVLTKPKQGFSIPIKNWLRHELRPMMMDLLNPTAISQQGWFNSNVVSSWVDDYMHSRVDHSHRLWALMVVQMWHRNITNPKLVHA